VGAVADGDLLTAQAIASFKLVMISWPTLDLVPARSFDAFGFFIDSYPWHTFSRGEERVLEFLPFCLREIGLLVFRINGQKEQRECFAVEIVNHADAAALASSLGSPAHLSNAAALGNHCVIPIEFTPQQSGAGLVTRALDVVARQSAKRTAGFSF